MSNRARQSEALRQNYLSLILDMKDSREELIDPTSSKLVECLEEANTLYQNVKSAREQALDSQALSLISTTAVEQLERFRTDFKERHTPKQFVDRLHQWLGGAEESSSDEEDDDSDDEATQPARRSRGNKDKSVDWNLLGRRVSPYISQTPACDFMYGLMDIPEKPARKVTKRTKEKTRAVVQAEEGVDTANQVGKETTEHIKTLYNTVQKEKSKPLYDTIVNPHSFGQTVENFFYLSFLVKDGRVKIHADSEHSEPWLDAAREPSADDYSKGIADRKQCVVRLDYSFWDRVKREKNIRSSLLPNRDYSNFEKEAEVRRARIAQLPPDSDDEEAPSSPDTQPPPTSAGKRARSESTSSQRPAKKAKKRKQTVFDSSDDEE